MRKSGWGLIGALLPILYCGGLIYYFLDLSGSFHEADQDGLGPTVLGLAAVGLLFCVPLLVKIIRLFAKPRPPGSCDGPDGPSEDDTTDADAIIARYRARQAAEAATVRTAPHPQDCGGAAGRPSFGRKTR
jgi:hypothetical protein